MTRQWRGVIEEYRDWLPVPPDLPVVTLGEGGTPLVRSSWLSDRTDSQVWLKVEAGNPTGSFKDRGMTVAVSVALAEGSQATVCASTGNTAASMSAYSTRAGMTPIVLVPRGGVAPGKLAQAVVHGACILQIRGGFDRCLELARELATDYPVSLVNSVNPMRIAGQQTAAFEIVDALGEVPDIHVLPVGNAGNITAYWAGFQAYAGGGRADQSPALWGFQAEGAAPLVRGEVVPDPKTVASAIRIGNPASWRLADAARDESGGLIEAVSDDEILNAQAELARRDGVFVEPASAAGVAGLLRLAAAGRVTGGQRITVTVTGHGLKDVDTALTHRGRVPDLVIDDDVDQAAAAAGLRDA